MQFGKIFIIGVIIAWVLCCVLTIWDHYLTHQQVEENARVAHTVEARQDRAQLIDAETLIAELNERAKAKNEDSERFFSPDMKYAVYISESLDPWVEQQIRNGNFPGEEGNTFINGVCLFDCQSGESHELISPDCEIIRDHITNIIWGLFGEEIYFTSGNDLVGSYSVFSCTIADGKVSELTSGTLKDLLLEEPYIGYLEVVKSCFIEEEGGRHWYTVAISPDGKKEVQLTQPTLDK